jgi:hypothetical protein
MGTFQTFSGNGGAFRWGEFRRFTTTSTTKKQTVMTYDADKSGTYDPAASPFKIILKTKKKKKM